MNWLDWLFFTPGGWFTLAMLAGVVVALILRVLEGMRG